MADVPYPGALGPTTSGPPVSRHSNTRSSRSVTPERSSSTIGANAFESGKILSDNQVLSVAELGTVVEGWKAYKCRRTLF
jgi:hypothetical protein